MMHRLEAYRLLRHITQNCKFALTNVFCVRVVGGPKKKAPKNRDLGHYGYHYTQPWVVRANCVDSHAPIEFKSLKDVDLYMAAWRNRSKANAHLQGKSLQAVIRKAER